MAKITRFEELIAWQKARVMTREIYRVSGSGNFRQDFALKDQIRRAAVSVMSNIAEGFERGGRGELHQMLSIAKSSCGEVRSHLYVALDAGYLDEKAFSALQASADEVGKIVGGLRVSVGEMRER
jgi:four helix bundle protein